VYVMYTHKERPELLKDKMAEKIGKMATGF
jgi:hypothetical protein